MLDGRSGLLGRLARGGAWLSSGTIIEQGLRFARNMILARILLPEEFGLMAIILSVISVFNVLTAIGLKEAVIQNPRAEERVFLNGVWWLGLARSVLLYIVALFLTPWITDFYDAPPLQAMLPIAFISVLAQGLFSPIAYLELKHLHYRRWVFIQNGGALLGIITTIILALALKDVWALVLGYVTESVTRTAFSHLFCCFHPGIRMESTALSSLLAFSSGIFGLPLLLMIYTEASVFALGKMLPKCEVGTYALVLSLARIPSMVAGMLVDLMTPAFSILQREPRRIRHTFLGATTVVLYVGLPTLTLIAAYGDTILDFVYGKKYAASYLLFVMLFCNELLFAMAIPIASAFIAVGKPTYLRRFSLVRALLMLALLYPAINSLGVYGAALAPLIAMLVAFILYFRLLRSIMNLRISQYLQVVLRCTVVAIPFAALLALTLPLKSMIRWRPASALLVGICVLAYGGILIFAFWHIRCRRYFLPFGSQTSSADM